MSTTQMIERADETPNGRDAVEDVKLPARSSSWGLWASQVLSIMRLELARNLLSKRATLIYLLAALPPLLLMVLAIFPPETNEWDDIGGTKTIFAVLYETLILRAVVFFGCAWIFMNLIRGEVIDRSLHYYFLAPVRREVFIVGKYLAGVVTAVMFFGTTTVLSLLLIHLPHHAAAGMGDSLGGSGTNLMFAYVATTALACIGYGAIFLLFGLYFRNPIIPALLFYGWEWINFLLPPALKKLSVIHYMHSLQPVPLPSDSVFEVLAAPTPAYISVPGLLIFSFVVLLLCARRIRRMEILYGGE